MGKNELQKLLEAQQKRLKKAYEEKLAEATDSFTAELEKVYQVVREEHRKEWVKKATLQYCNIVATLTSKYNGGMHGIEQAAAEAIADKVQNN